MFKYSAITARYPRKSLSVKTELRVGIASCLRVRKGSVLPKYSAIWDTGATNSVITRRIVDQLKLNPVNKAISHGVTGEYTTDVYLINMILLPNNLTLQNVKVTEGKLHKGVDVLLGMDIVTLGDFAITNAENRTTFSYRVPSVKEIDFVGEYSEKSS